MRLFLTAEWRHLLMLNYSVEPALLQSYCPKGVELDSWNGKTYASMVGFMFLNTRVRGLGIPFHRNFEEVNLRFYVRRNTPEGWRRGVVFIREIVPRTLIAKIARAFYNEPYIAAPMRHSIEMENGRLKNGGLVKYGWRHHKEWNHISATVSGPPEMIAAGSEAEFITEHYWGYTAQRNGGCKEYQVEHPRWKVWPAKDPVFQCDISSLYGPQLVAPLTAPPLSVFVAEGSMVKVFSGSTF